MNLFWKNKDPYNHRVKPPKAKPRDKDGYIKFLIAKQNAIYHYLLKEGVKWEDLTELEN